MFGNSIGRGVIDGASHTKGRRWCALGHSRWRGHDGWLRRMACMVGGGCDDVVLVRPSAPDPHRAQGTATARRTVLDRVLPARGDALQDLSGQGPGPDPRPAGGRRHGAERQRPPDPSPDRAAPHPPGKRRSAAGVAGDQALRPAHPSRSGPAPAPDQAPRSGARLPAYPRHGASWLRQDDDRERLGAPHRHRDGVGRTRRAR